MSIKLGATFDTFGEFENEFRKFQAQNNVLFVSKSTRSIAGPNAHLSPGLERFKQELKYSHAVYVCKHAGSARVSGTGMRPQQRTMKKQCPALLVLVARRKKQILEITKLDLSHNHEVSAEIYQSYPERRRLTEEERNYVQHLLELHVPPRTIIEKLYEKYGKKVMAKDIHNLKRDRNGTVEACPLEEAVQKCKDKFHAKIVQVISEGQELQMLLMQTPYMQKALISFPEVLLLDTTHWKNSMGMPLFVFIVLDGSGTHQVVTYAFVSSEEHHLVTKLVEIFAEENPCTAKTKVVVVDIDFPEVSAIKRTFKGSPTVQLSPSQVMKAFRTTACQLSKGEKERERLFSCFAGMVHAPTASQFDQARSKFTSCASEAALSYFESNWANVQDMWARHLCNLHSMGGYNVVKRMESHNFMVKNVLKSCTQFHEVLYKLLTVADDLRKQAQQKLMQLTTFEFYSYGATVVERLCAKVLTPYACNIIGEEVKKAKGASAVVRQISAQEYTVSCSEEGRYSISLERQRCSCAVSSTMGFLCWHFLAVCAKHNVQPNLKKAVSQRWFKSFQATLLTPYEEVVVVCDADTEQGMQHPSTSTAVEECEIDTKETMQDLSTSTAAEGCDTNSEQVMPDPSTSTPDIGAMNRDQRYIYVMESLKSLADCLADCQPDVLNSRLSLLENIKSSWERGDNAAEEEPTMGSLNCSTSPMSSLNSTTPYVSLLCSSEQRKEVDKEQHAQPDPNTSTVDSNKACWLSSLPAVNFQNPPKHVYMPRKRKRDLI
ncbi:uncharacterized protein LOC144125233 [Amblyomma americanum]